MFCFHFLNPYKTLWDSFYSPCSTGEETGTGRLTESQVAGGRAEIEPGTSDAEAAPLWGRTRHRSVSQPAGDPGELRVLFQLGLKAREPREPLPTEKTSPNQE